MAKTKYEVEDYQFTSFNNAGEKAHLVTNFEFQPIAKLTSKLKTDEYQKVIQIERRMAKENKFKINPIVEKHRGMIDQEEAEYQKRIEIEVQKRVEAIQEDAYRAGFEEGVNQGREEIFEEMRNVVDQRLDNVTQMVHEVLKTQEDLMTKQQKEIYSLIKSLTKWIILRELKDDGHYVERLLEKLIMEIQTKNNLLIQVNSENFKEIPEVLEHIKVRLGEISNVRVEIDSQISSYGMIIESENGIIDATLEEQFKSLDKLFEDVLQD